MGVEEGGRRVGFRARSSKSVQARDQISDLLPGCSVFEQNFRRGVKVVRGLFVVLVLVLVLGVVMVQGWMGWYSAHSRSKSVRMISSLRREGWSRRAGCIDIDIEEQMVIVWTVLLLRVRHHP